MWQPLGMIHGYAARFGGCGNIYHPNEAAAAMFATVAIGEVLEPATGNAPARLPAGRAWKSFAAWCAKHLTVAPQALRSAGHS